MTPYSSPQSPAQNVDELLDFLIKEHRNEYVYRGQTKEYPGPLFPSAYRFKHLTGEVYDTKSPEYKNSMRKVGKKFIGIHRFKNFADIFLAYSGEKIIRDPHEVELLRSISINPKTVELIAGRGFEAALRLVLPAGVFKKYESRLSTWKRVLNQQHRALIRLNGCNEFLGYPVGQTLGQHYVENSELLDVTASPEIAAFFATYAGPDYVTSVGRDPNSDIDIGIIYRFPIDRDQSVESKDFDYYTVPSFVDALEVVRRLEVNPSTQPEWDPSKFVVYFSMADGLRLWETIQLTSGVASDSRIGRQKACLLIPDELHVETRDSWGRQDVSFQAVEDLAYREGTEKFYFQHSDDGVLRGGVSADTLWPANADGEQAFLELLECITISEKLLHMAAAAQGKTLIRMEHNDLWIPPRPEFLETGPLYAGQHSKD